MSEERNYPDLTPVKHKKDGYVGWIDGITKMKEIFTGNTDCVWQYRVFIPGEEKKKIAPQKDLKINTKNPPLPTTAQENRDEESGFRRETLLHALGYHLTDMTRHQREDVLLKIAIPYLKLQKVVKTILDLIYAKKKKISQTKNAVVEWNYDLDMLLRTFGLDHEELAEILDYILTVKKILIKEHILFKDSFVDDIEKILKKHKKK